MAVGIVSRPCGSIGFVGLSTMMLASASSPAVAQTSPLPPLPPPDPVPSSAEASPAVETAPSSAPPPSPPSPASPPLMPPTRGRENASAEEPPAQAPAPFANVWATRRLAIELQLGFGAPLGYLGVAVDYSPLPVLALNAGVGFGGVGLQYALSGRLRLARASSHGAPYFGAGFSAGAYQTPPGFLTFSYDAGDTSDGGAYYHWDMAYWTNVEIGGEVRSGSYVTFRGFAGLGLLLNPGSAVAVGYTSPGGVLPPPGFS
jgi:hypothetical protein